MLFTYLVNFLNNILAYEDDNKCLLAPKKGTCNGDEERYYYDSENDVCKTFTYTGCSGNANNFESIEACEFACKSK